MPHRMSRRSLLAVAGALALRARAGTSPSVPPSLDHILLGCGDLQGGIDFVERHLGVRAAFGGVHPGRGSRNALLALGERRYLEIIAPDPQQPTSADMRQLHRLAAPQLIGWASHVDDMDAVIQKLTAAKVAFEPVRAGSRQRPSGQMLRWKALALRDDKGGLLPFFIEWSKDSLHPAVDAPAGGRLDRFELVAPRAEELRSLTVRLQLDVAVATASPAALHAALSGPSGSLALPG
jgi:Glyoxalase-like domain